MPHCGQVHPGPGPFRGAYVTAYRHFWELCVLATLRDGLRSGDVYVPITIKETRARACRSGETVFAHSVLIYPVDT